MSSPQVPKTCKAAVFEKANQPLVIKDVDVPQPEKGQVLIKVVRSVAPHLLSLTVFSFLKSSDGEGENRGSKKSHC